MSDTECPNNAAGEEESHPLASPMAVIGVAIEKYGAEHAPQHGQE